MLVDYIVLAALQAGFALLLNMTLFKSKPAPISLALIMSAVVFFVTFVLFSLFTYIRFTNIQTATGMSIHPSSVQHGTEFGYAFALVAFVFYPLLKKGKEISPKHENGTDPTDLGEKMTGSSNYGHAGKEEHECSAGNFVPEKHGMAADGKRTPIAPTSSKRKTNFLLILLIMVLAVPACVMPEGNTTQTRSTSMTSSEHTSAHILDSTVPKGHQVAPMQHLLFQALGYSISQNIALDYIRAAYPQLERQVHAARSKFENSVFGGSISVLEDVIEEEVGEMWRSIRDDVIQNLKESMVAPDLSVEEASAFIAEVIGRSEGIMHEEVRATLLAINPRYKQKPELEFLDGWWQTYRTQKHPKAKGQDFSFSIPLSWSLREGHRPNVVQFFHSRYGNGPIMCSIVVLEIPEEYSLSESEMDEAFHPDSLRLLVPGDAAFISAQSITMEGNPAGLLVYDLTQQQIDKIVTMRMTQFITIENNVSINLQFMITPLFAATKTFDELQEHYYPLFRLIANSYIPHDRYIQDSDRMENTEEPLVDTQTVQVLAETGNASAQYRLSVLYARGEVGPPDREKSMYWFLRSVENGYAEAQNDLGLMYANGVGVPKDPVEAVKWLRKAAEQHYAKAQNNLGTMYNKGEGVPLDQKEAVKWFVRASDQGFAGAQNNLGEMYMGGLGVDLDYHKARSLFLEAAEQGHAVAQNNLGLVYDAGLGVKQDFEEAAKWFRKSAEQNEPMGQYNLGLMCYHGTGVPRDYRESIKWYEKAAAQEFAPAKNNLGVMYKEGVGVPQNSEEAVKWYRRAAAQGYPVAQLNLGLMYFSGEGVPQDYVKAYALMALASAYDDDAAILRDALAEDMTEHQIGKALVLVVELSTGKRTLE